MFSRKTEITVGVFMVIGVIALVYLSVSLGKIDFFGTKFYTASAMFDSITGLKKGSTVEIAGVQVGKVKEIALEEDMARVDMSISREVKLSEDTIASIRTKGVIGE